MSLPETDVARVRRWVAEENERIGEHVDEMRVEMDVKARAITILEDRGLGELLGLGGVGADLRG